MSLPEQLGAMTRRVYACHECQRAFAAWLPPCPCGDDSCGGEVVMIECSFCGAEDPEEITMDHARALLDEGYTDPVVEDRMAREMARDLLDKNRIVQEWVEYNLRRAIRRRAAVFVISRVTIVVLLVYLALELALRWLFA